MSDGKEIKLNEEAFNTAISKLTGYKNTLVKSNDNFVSVNENMKKDWIGDGGTAFILSANVLESRFLERINDLDEEIKALEDTKQSLFNEDSFLSKAIEGAITAAQIAASAEN